MINVHVTNSSSNSPEIQKRNAFVIVVKAGDKELSDFRFLFSRRAYGTLRIFTDDNERLLCDF